MPVTRISATTAAVLALLSAPAFAQTSGAPTPSTMQTGTTAPMTNSASAEPDGSLTKSHGDFRSSQLVGATVYNDQGNSIGTIDNLLVDSGGKVAQAVISVGGFLGVGSKLVAVPFDQLKFRQSGPGMTGHMTNAVGSSQSGNYFSVTFPSATKNSLTRMPTFTYGT